MSKHKDSLLENVEQAKSILRKANIPTDHEDYQIIRGMLEKKVGWVGMFTKFRFEEDISIEDLAQTFDQLIELEAYLNRLPQQVTKYPTYEKLVDALNRLQVTKCASRFYQELTSTFKQRVKGFNDEQRGDFDRLAYDFYALNDVQQKRVLQKLKSFEPVSFLDELAVTIDAVAADFDYDSIKAQIHESSGGAEVVYESEDKNILVVRIKNFAASMLLSSRTLWCIRNSISNWRGYVDGDGQLNTQYTVYNFNMPSTDKLSMIGVTIKPKYQVRAIHARYDEAIDLPTFKKYLKKYNIDFKVLAPLEGEELVARKEHQKRRKKLKEALDTFSYAKVMQLLTAEDVESDGMVYLEFAVRWGRIDLLKKIESMGCVVNPSTDRAHLFSSACSSSNKSMIDYLISKGYPVTTAHKIDYVAYLMRQNDNIALIKAFFNEHPATEDVLNGMFMHLAQDDYVHQLKDFTDAFPVELTPALTKSIDDMFRVSTRIKGDMAKVLFDMGYKPSEQAMVGICMNFNNVYRFDREGATVYLDVIKANMGAFSHKNTPVTRIANNDDWDSLEALLKIGMPDDSRGSAVSMYIKQNRFNDADAQLTKDEKNGRLSLSEFITHYMQDGKKATLQGLKFIHERGINSGGTVYKYFSGIDLVAKAVRFHLGYDVVKYLLSLEYYTTETDIINQIVAMASANGDTAMVRKLNHQENVTDDVLEATVAHMVKNGQIDELIEYVSDATEEFQYALPADAMVELLQIEDRDIFEQLFKNSIKSLPINKLELPNILLRDFAFKMEVVAKLNFDARDLVAVCATHNFKECAKALMESKDAKIIAKIAKRRAEILQYLGSQTTAAAVYMRGVLEQEAPANESRQLRYITRFVG